MTNIEQAAREKLREAVRKAHDEAHDLADNPEYGGDPLDSMVRRLAEYLLSDENVEKAARAIAAFTNPEAWTFYRGEARAALSAALGKEY